VPFGAAPAKPGAEVARSAGPQAWGKSELDDPAPRRGRQPTPPEFGINHLACQGVAGLCSAAVSASSYAILVSLVAGLAGSVQVAVSEALRIRIDMLEATAFGSIGPALIVTAVVVAAGQGLGGVASGLREPPWLWLNGVMGAIVVMSITFAAPRVGTFATIGLLIAGQLAMGVFIDALGLFGLEKIPLNWPRVVGVVLLALGAVLTLKR